MGDSPKVVLLGSMCALEKGEGLNYLFRREKERGKEGKREKKVAALGGSP